MWSVMRMLSAVVLPDRDKDQIKGNESHPMLSTYEIVNNKPQECRESCSPTLSLDIMTEDEDPQPNTNESLYFQSSEVS